ncbi:MAG: tRNA pseudouridine(13) synthase TruD, partial [Candidatus Micrarchaeota archaeon]|nr:tRNA pseudouridine(13) synthase TruD [Candidatus Micrarchaeota archaeon]
MLRLSSSPRMAGSIKASAQDFVVEEILGACRVLEKDINYPDCPIQLSAFDPKFSVFIMQKENWNTVQALRAVANALRRGQKSTGFAGT